MLNGETTILVKKDTREKLEKIGKKGEKCDDIIRRLMEFHEEVDLDAYIKEMKKRLKDKDKFIGLEEYAQSRGI